MKYFIKVYKNKVANANLSLLTKVSIQTLIGNIKNESSIISAKSLQAYNTLYFWDLGVNATRQIRKGDTLFIKSGNDLFKGKIEIIIEDEYGGIGDAIGWARQYKVPWKNPIGLLKIERFPIEKSLENEIEDAINNGKKQARNFYEIFFDLAESSLKDTRYVHNKSIKEENIISEPNIILGKDRKISDYDDEQNKNTNISRRLDTELGNIIKQIEILKETTHHSEREHESLVEKFFSYLGYEYPRDIKYRVGYIDILIQPNTRNSIVVEVKRDWSLSRKHNEVVDQAYGYAIKYGSRFVVITNGDYYAFFDRLRGLSIKENFDFELKLSQINDNNIQLLKKYRKSSLM